MFSPDLLYAILQVLPAVEVTNKIVIHNLQQLQQLQQVPQVQQL